MSEFWYWMRPYVLFWLGVSGTLFTFLWLPSGQFLSAALFCAFMFCVAFLWEPAHVPRKGK